jgi:predicted nucleic acid-binding protein
MNSPVCIDASILLKLVVEEADSDLVDRCWESWILNSVQVIAPSLSRYEVTAVLTQKAQGGQLSEALARSALSAALDMEEIEFVDSVDLHLRAWELACRLDLPSPFDAHYLALAQMRDCELWTADRRLYNSVKDELAYVRLVSS